MGLIGNSALVVGGGRGIGRAAAIELARRGADVAIAYRSDAAAARETCEAIAGLGRRAWSFGGDVADAASAATLFTTSRRRNSSVSSPTISAASTTWSTMRSACSGAPAAAASWPCPR
jgi:NAD(P)-dependent dehydrogenase (short-subunit alcohol dehydrogenase family)